jgi:hypothetical protein
VRWWGNGNSNVVRSNGERRPKNEREFWGWERPPSQGGPQKSKKSQRYQGGNVAMVGLAGLELATKRLWAPRQSSTAVNRDWPS